MTWIVEKSSKKMRIIDFADDCSASNLGVITAHARSLRKLTLGRVDSIRIPWRVYQFPRLRCVTLQYHKAEGNRAFLGILDAPVLDQIYIRSGSREVDELARYVPRFRSLRELVVPLVDNKPFSAPNLVAICRAVGCSLSFVLPTHTALENLVNHSEHLDQLKLDLTERPMHDQTVALPAPRCKRFERLRKFELNFQWYYSTYHDSGSTEITGLACSRFWEYACNLLQANAFPSLEDWNIRRLDTTHTILDEIAMVVLSRRVPKLARLKVALSKFEEKDERGRKSMQERKAECAIKAVCAEAGIELSLSLTQAGFCYGIWY